MTDEYPTTIIIRRPAKVTTDGRGRAVWGEPIEDTELELMSTQALQAALECAEQADRDSMQALAEGDKDGVLVRDLATGLFEIMSEEELKLLLENDANEMAAKTEFVNSANLACSGEGDQLSLASTQILRKVLKGSDSSESGQESEDSTSRDPYNSA